MKQNRNTISVDTIIGKHNRRLDRVSFLHFKKNKESSSSVLLSKGKISNAFFTEDSKLYVSPKQQQLGRKGVVFNEGVRQWDCVSSRIVRRYVSQCESRSREGLLLVRLQKRIDALGVDLRDVSDNFFRQFSLVRLWNMSIVGAILLGMVTTTFLYRYLGQGAAAQGSVALGAPSVRNERMIDAKAMSIAEGDLNLESQDAAATGNMGADEEELLKDLTEMKDDMFREKVKEMVKGYPIEKMLPYILEKDKKVVAFMIGIAKKESSWGEHVPVLDGQDCFNYWGYRGQRKLMGTGGHTCFNSRKDAVETVSKRIATLVHEKGKDTPEKMILWKCGSACSGASDEKKWVSDVNLYFKKLDS